MNTQKSLVQDWLNTARWAASGGNAQAWLVNFEETDNLLNIELGIDPNYVVQHSPLDAEGAASAMALGALATNLKFLAARDGFALSQKIHEAHQSFWDSKLILKFSKLRDATARAHLDTHISAKDILKRQTNRCPFSQTPIPEQARNTILTCVAKYPDLALHEIAAQDKKTFIKELLPLETIRWRSQVYLNSLLDEINTDTDINSHPNQIPLSQLGLNGLDQSFFRFMKKSKFLKKLMRKILYKAVIPKSLSNFTKHCDKLYLVEAKDTDFKACVELGSFFQEVWLELNKQNIAFQPWGTPLVALGFWQNESTLDLTAEQIHAVKQVTARAEEKYHLHLKNPVMGFRVGQTEQSHDKAPRSELLGHRMHSKQNVV